MKTSFTGVIVALFSVAVMMALTAAPLFAQQTVPPPPADVQVPNAPAARGYLTGVAGFALFPNIPLFSTPGERSTPNIAIETGVRIVPHLMVFGEGGWMQNLQSGVQQTLVTTTTTLFSTHNYVVTGTGSVRVWYGLGGLRIAGPTWGKFTPYVLGGAGLANLDPVAHFTYTSGTLTGVTTPAVGTDVTAALTTAGYFKAPVSSTKLMLMAGGGVQLNMGAHGVADARYRYSRIPPSAALGSGELSTNAISIGIGVRF